MLSLLHAVGKAAGTGGLVPSVIIKRAIASNGNLFPYTTVSSSNFVRNYRKMRITPQNANYSALQLTYANFLAQVGAEISTGLDNITIRAGIEYDGVFYPVTFSGARDVSLTAGEYAQSDYVSGLTLPAGAIYYERVRVVGTSGSQPRLYGHGAQNYLLEGVLASTDTGVDYTLGGEASGATVSATVSGGVITGASVTNSGSNYISGTNLVAYELQADGTIKTQTVGYGVRSGDGMSSAVITSGGSGWVSPTLVFTGGGGFGQNNAIYAAALITGQPDLAVQSLLLIGDSIARGFGSSDGEGDLSGNYGIYERAIANRFGIGNLSSVSNTAAAHQLTAAHEKMYAIYSTLPTHVLIQNGTNDFVSGATKSSVVNNNGVTATTWRAQGAAVSYATILPRTTSTDGWTTTTNQTETTGHGVSGPAQSYNAELLNNTISSDWNIVDAAVHGADTSAPTKWRVDQASALTPDGIHPDNLGLPFLASQIASYFDALQ